MTPRHHVVPVPGPPPGMDKRGDEAAIGREAAALGVLAGRPWAPALLAREPGRIVTARLAGAPRAWRDVTPAEGRRLGALLRKAHETRRAARGWLWWWPASAADVEAYRRGRAADAARALGGVAAADLLGAAAPAAVDPAPFRLLHGDLVAGNVVWGPDGPALVDWEFWRMGDPAEDLAYLIEVGGVPDDLAAEVRGGYGVSDVLARIDAWRAIVAADAGGWYLAHGMPHEGARLRERSRALVTPPPR